MGGRGGRGARSAAGRRREAGGQLPAASSVFVCLEFSVCVCICVRAVHGVNRQHSRALYWGLEEKERFKPQFQFL